MGSGVDQVEVCGRQKWSRTEPPKGPECPLRGGTCGKQGSEAGHTPPRHCPAGWNPGPLPKVWEQP